MISFKQLLESIDNVTVMHDINCEIRDVCYDSRKASEGSVFVALNGINTDGVRYIFDAIDSGATAVVTNRFIEGIPENIAYAVAKDTREALGKFSSLLFGNPSKDLKLIGITATSGKTTVSHIVYSILNVAGYLTGLIGTINMRVGKEIIDSTHTTPQSRELQEIFSKMVETDTKACVMEVSSHSLDQSRVTATDFDVVAFLNVSRDHLDYHKTVENYKNAKLKLFTKYSSNKTVAVVNTDDLFSKNILSSCKSKVITFSAKDTNADVYATDSHISGNYVKFVLNIAGDKTDITFNMGGEFNIYNALAAASITYAMGISIEDIKKGIEVCKPVTGRFESIPNEKNISVIVDYAHTPDELEKVLESAKRITKDRIIVVFGCGGNRDSGKRPIMGMIATRNADYAIITSDNPRFEDPNLIIDQIYEGIEPEYNSKTWREPRRYKAIEKAITMAHSGDVIILAGKGHETYQEIKGERFDFDDSKVARIILDNL